MSKVQVVNSVSSIPKSVTAKDRPVFSDGLDALPAKLQEIVRLQGFKGGVAKTLVIPSTNGSSVEVLVGLGSKKSLTINEIRKAVAAYAKVVSNHSSAAITMASVAGDLDPVEVVAAITEGIQLACYSYNAEKGKAHKKKKHLQNAIIVSKARGSAAVAAKAVKVCDSVNLARDLGNHPGGSLTPVEFAKVAKKQGTKSGLKVTVWDKARIKKEKLGGLLAVNQGSEHDPRLVRLQYIPKVKKPKAHVVLVGKGITFDSGGLSLKTPQGMMTMKIDMAGGAAVLAAMCCLQTFKVPITVTGIIPLTDNMTGGLAQRPGDTFTARNKKTVEVLNTDAEGRLVLADGLSLAAELEPDAIIDIATLTGSVSVALGKDYAGLMSNNLAVSKKISAASKLTGEKMWRLPLPSDYRKQLDSFVADIKNIGSGSYGGTLTAGLFLKEFVNDVPWAHIDLGLAAFADSAKGYHPKGATGFGVRTLVQTLADWK